MKNLTNKVLGTILSICVAISIFGITGTQKVGAAPLCDAWANRYQGAVRSYNIPKTVEVIQTYAVLQQRWDRNYNTFCNGFRSLGYYRIISTNGAGTCPVPFYPQVGRSAAIGPGTIVYPANDFPVTEACGPWTPGFYGVETLHTKGYCFSAKSWFASYPAYASTTAQACNI